MVNRWPTPEDLLWLVLAAKWGGGEGEGLPHGGQRGVTQGLCDPGLPRHAVTVLPSLQHGQGTRQTGTFTVPG